MSHHARKTMPSREPNDSAKGSAQKNVQQAIAFHDNRRDAATQRKLAKMTHSYSPTLPTDGIAQLKRMDKEVVKAELNQDAKGRRTLDILDTCEVQEVDSLLYNNNRVGIYGLTLPDERPPVIFIDHTNTPNDQVSALTLFHESLHVVDKDAPAGTDDSVQAVQQDNVNEAKTWRAEAEYALERGGEYLEDAKKQKSVILDPSSGKYVLNEKVFSDLANGAYDNTEPRSNRYTRALYKAIGAKDLSGNWKVGLSTGQKVAAGALGGGIVGGGIGAGIGAAVGGPAGALVGAGIGAGVGAIAGAVGGLLV
ncbi:hypothetical protein [Reinekea sp. G2M2-21]|uniref:hypothetical protein n=1 Tax=Reinekea sp. G2M2-21 TaxID=2788942 RepID=UPI0018AC413E|nr:hypothetical protein [Reinekea sp. G2M2-21]